MTPTSHEPHRHSTTDVSSKGHPMTSTRTMTGTGRHRSWVVSVRRQSGNVIIERGSLQ